MSGDMWDERKPIKVMLPEINSSQYPILQRAIQEILGTPVDTQALVNQGRRSEAKDGFAVNQRLTEQTTRLNKLFGIKETKREVTEWWK